MGKKSFFDIERFYFLLKEEPEVNLSYYQKLGRQYRTFDSLIDFRHKNLQWAEKIIIPMIQQAHINAISIQQKMNERIEKNKRGLDAWIKTMMK